MWFVGQDKFIHAPRRGRPIQIESLSEGWFGRRYVGARRFTPDYF